jgi:hypothetical protein
MVETEPAYLPQDIDYLGFLGSKVADLQGMDTLVYELVQNADDAPGVTSIVFDVRDDALEVSNNGVFREIDFKRMQKIAGRGKRDEENTSGAFGIGFIAVYQITDRPELFSAGRHWIFRPDERGDRRIEETKVANVNGTRFRLPWAFDPNTPLRRELRVAGVHRDEVTQLAENLATALPKALLFLRKIYDIEIRRNGKTRRNVSRMQEGNRLVLKDGNQSVRWFLIDGAFPEQAASLREKFGRVIEDKRKHNVTIAIPEGSSDCNGLLCAFLPTQMNTGLSFHINADFFPSSDRKRVLFDTGYRGDWNRAAVSAAAEALAKSLPQLPEILGHKALWTLIASVQSKESDAMFGEVWKQLEPKLPYTAVVYSSVGTWHKPSEIRFLEKVEEHDAIPILEALGVDVVHSDLRSHQNLLLRRTVGVKLLEAGELARAVCAAGLDRVCALANAPEWLQSRETVAKLAREFKTLLDRRMTEEQRNAARDLISACAIAIGQDGQLHPLRDLRKADKDTIDLFSKIGIRSCFLARDNPTPLEDLVDSFDLDAALVHLSSLPAEAFETSLKTTGWKPSELLRWFELRKSALSADKTALLQKLPVFPSGGRLRPLTNLAQPGEFTDPLQLASLIDLAELPGLHDFIRELGAPKLTFKNYCWEQVPAAFAGNEVITPEARRKLLLMLADHLGEIRDDEVARSKLADCPLTECEDGEFRKPSEVYFAGDLLRLALGDGIALSKEASTHREAVHELLLWLGVVAEPRATDLRHRIKTLTQKPPVPESRAAIKAIFAHLGTRWKNSPDELEDELEELKKTSWLLAVADQSSWHTPTELYSSKRSYIFATQARFLDVEAPVQDQSTEFMLWLGIKTEPTTALVVRHLLECAAADREVHREVYSFLNGHADDREISILFGKPVLLLSSGAYVRPDQVFWQEHPFGIYRYRLDSELRVYGKLLERLKVRESPHWDDAVRVLREASEQYGSTNTPLDEATYAIVIECWIFLERALTAEQIDKETLQEHLEALKSVKVVPDHRRLLVRPDRIFFEDRPGLASIFGDLIKNDTIRRVQNAWRAMESAGVKSLSRAVRSNLVDAPESAPAKDVLDLLAERRGLIARVIEAYDSTSDHRSDLSRLDDLRIERARELEVSFRIEVFGREHTTEPESVAVYYDQCDHVLYFIEHNSPPWAAIARELAYVLNPEAEAGQLAPGLKEVLAARTISEAVELLDELGYARLEARPTTTGDIPSPVNLGGINGALTTLLIPTPTDATKPSFENPVPPPLPKPLSQGSGQISDEAISETRQDTSVDINTTKQRSRLRTYVAPPEASATPDHTDASTRRSRVEQAGINRVLEYERQVHRHPDEMPVHHPGYDIQSKNASGDVERYIEVKALLGKWDKQGAGVSRTQFNKAREIGDRYWLYVVERAEDSDFRILRIHDPARKVDQYFYDDGWRGLAESDPADLPDTSEEPEITDKN